VGLIDNLEAHAKANPVMVGQPEILQDLGDGEVIMRIGYRYNVTGLDMDLQKYPDLMLNVEGSCMTEYSWRSPIITQIGNTNIPAETYNPFNDSTVQLSVSVLDGPEPRAFLSTAASPMNL